MAHWFKHDNTSLTDQKILALRFKYGMEGYGIFWALMETMHQDSTGYINREAIGGLSIVYGVPIDKLNGIVDFCIKTGLLHQCEHGNVFSERMKAQKAELAESTTNGRKGAEIRWKNRGTIARPKPANGDTNADQIRSDKIRKDTQQEGDPVGAAFIAMVNKNQELPPEKQDHVLVFLTKTLRINAEQLLKLTELYGIPYVMQKARLTQKRFKDLENPPAYFMKACKDDYQDFEESKSITLAQKKEEMERLKRASIEKIEKLLRLGYPITGPQYMELPEARKEMLMLDEEGYKKTMVFTYYDPNYRLEPAK